ncbi:MAG: hypothetical protein QOD68_733 [Actinomycetota bacterium]|nr:hypothetical protein [Actinomycetota bacterium]
MVDAFSHVAFLYSDLAEFLDETCGFVREGLERDEAVLVATGGDRLTGLRSFFGTEPDVQLVQMSQVGANPARIIPVWRQFLDEHVAAGRSVRGIGEPIWAGRTEAELAECHQHESLLNLAFGAGPGWRLLCPYDVSALPEDVIEEARANHPLVLDGGRWSASDRYHPERARRALRHRPLPPAPTEALELVFTVGDLAAVRRVVERFSVAEGLAECTTDDLVLCVDEMASNSLLHGGGDGVLRMWREPTEVICEISDAGSIADPLVGRENPAVDRLGGRGLWMANQLCDLVQVRSGAFGTVVRLHVHLA